MLWLIITINNNNIFKECNSYITNLELDKLRLRFSNIKFKSMDDVENLAD